MNEQTGTPSRRKALKAGCGLAVLGVGAGAAYLLHWPGNDRQLVLTRLEDALREVERLQAAAPRALEPATAWGWPQTLAHCAQSGIECLQLFANRLRKYWPGILARVRWPMHTGQLEGINNRIKVIKRMAYGYRDVEYFFLKIKAAFPGNA